MNPSLTTTSIGPEWKEIEDLIDEIKANQEDPQLLESNLDKQKKEFEAEVKRVKSLTKEKERLEKELDSLNKGIAKAQDTIEVAEEKLRLIDENKTKKETKLAEKKAKEESILKLWDMLGLAVERVDDHVLVIKFTKLIQEEPEKEFVLRVSIKNNKVKILQVSPTDALDVELIESHFNKRTGTGDGKEKDKTEIDTRCLITLIRINLLERAQGEKNK